MRWLLKRWWFWAGTGFVIVALVTGSLLVPVSGARISQENHDKIQLGWNSEQVVELLGPSMTSTPLTLMPLVGGAGKPILLSMSWSDEDGNRIIVNFDGTLSVTEKYFTPTQLSLGERIQRRVERRIRALWP